ncbi:unnamed protein product [Allacma fusca]|uniref:Uncharacterized protein n=1 Tax=Allacma fusca TaxID=39272 RepID=A0A8J2M983_9HEXA|nr:unnamed protein product [Allacma fusca]
MCTIILVLFVTLDMATSAIEPVVGGWNPVQKKPAGKTPLGKFEKPTLKPTRVKKSKHQGYWPHGYDQIQIESNPKQALEVKAGLPVRYIQTGYDLTTLLAVSLVSAFFGAITYSVVESRGLRSMASPFSFLNLIDQETIVRALSSIVEKYENPEGSATTVAKTFDPKYTFPTFGSNSTRNARITRETTMPSTGYVLKWYLAYKKDPVDLKCLQKLVCESLATSTCAARSINSPFGSSIINGVKYFFGNAGDVADLITETVKNPEICNKNMFANYCNTENNSQPPHQPTHPIPAFNMSSITPRVTHFYHGSLKNNTRYFFNV